MLYIKGLGINVFLCGWYCVYFLSKTIANGGGDNIRIKKIL